MNFLHHFLVHEGTIHNIVHTRQDACLSVLGEHEVAHDRRMGQAETAFVLANQDDNFDVTQDRLGGDYQHAKTLRKRRMLPVESSSG